MGVVSEVLQSLEHAKAHSSGNDLDSLRLVLENSRDVLSMYVRLNEEKTVIPGDVKPKVNQLFGDIGGSIRELDRVLHMYDAGRIAYQEMLDYKKILEEDPNRLADVITDQHLRAELGDMLQPKQAFYKIRDVMKTNAEKIGPSKSKLVSQLADLEAGIGILNASVQAGFVSSTSEARRQIKAGGIKVNDVTVTDEKMTLTPKDLTSEGVIKLSLGKKKHVLLRAV